MNLLLLLETRWLALWGIILLVFLTAPVAAQDRGENTTLFATDVSPTTDFPWNSTSSPDSDERVRGIKGLKGDQGNRGLPGLDGIKGENGFPGRPGYDAVPGSRGKTGDEGFSGLPGESRYLPGDPGPPGDRGKPGPEGPQGEKGEQGNDGRDLPGLQGPPGKRGRDGQNGLPGIPGYMGAPSLTGTVYARHSQTDVIPVCGGGEHKLWEGFSLVSMETHGKHHHMDLGLSGSCLRKFVPLPFSSCNLGNVCRSADKTEKSYWLSAKDSVSKLPVASKELEPYVSRCVVCQTPNVIIVVHSQTTGTPVCPGGSNPVWSGYSSARISTAQGGDQSLDSAGSCLESFRRKILLLECNGADWMCNYQDNKDRIWLSTAELGEGFYKPILQTTISRCQVCSKPSNLFYNGI